MSQYAISVKNAYKAYGDKIVLDGLNMTVPRGCIYGLLGASGCGKTTLLSCIVGRKRLDAGEIFVCGIRPGKEGSGVPGSRVGYMPQDIALVAEFTVRDAVYYFGRILNMSEETINERFVKLKKLLDLPPDNRFLKNCSGGQQRRVSFAAAMIHKPEILILDEPTVGLDPILRDRIWEYLVKIAETEGTAIIITTHYIEEARQAHRIGLMRSGQLLAEESPDRLLSIFRKESLEDVFLVLSRKQEDGSLEPLPKLDVTDNIDISAPNAIARSESDISNIAAIGKSTDILTQNHRKTYSTTTSSLSLNRRRLKSLLMKNVHQFIRNPGGLCFTFIFPILEMLCFLYGIGGNIRDIPIGIANFESDCSNYTQTGTAVPFSYSSCHFNDLGCRFIHEIKDDPMFDIMYYDDFDEALSDIKHGVIVGVLKMNKNFSKSFEQRLNDARNLSTVQIEDGQIQVYMDLSNRQIGATIRYHLLKKYQNFQKDTFADCKFLPKLADLPMRFNFEYGDEDDSYMLFMIPGVILTVMFFLGTTLTSTIIITDRKDGVWDRSIVAGVSNLEIVLTHLITQFFLVFIQALEVMILTFYVSKVPSLGPLWIIFIYVLLNGLAGMVFGFLISIVSDSHSAANIAATGFFYPMIVLCGMIWPIDAQPTVLKFISELLPYTYPTMALRNLMRKGDAAPKAEVWNGMLLTFVWILLIIALSVFAIKRKR